MLMSVTPMMLTAIDLRGRGAHLDRSSTHLVAEVERRADDEHRDHQALDHRIDEVDGVLEVVEEQLPGPGGHVPEALDRHQVGRQVRAGDGEQVGDRQHDHRGEQSRGDEVGDRAHAHDVEGVDLLGDLHRPELGDDATAHLGGEDVPEDERDDLAHRAPGREAACHRIDAERARQSGGLQPAAAAGEERDPMITSTLPVATIAVWRRISAANARARGISRTRDQGEGGDVTDQPEEAQARHAGQLVRQRRAGDRVLDRTRRRAHRNTPTSGKAARKYWV